MKKIILKHYKNIYFFLLGASLIISAEHTMSLYHVQEEEPLKISQSLAKVENKIRKATKDFEKEGLKTYIQREPNSLVLRVWEDNLFPISDWKPYKKNAEFFTNIAEILKKSNQNVNVEIISHYDSINPFGRGDDEDNKLRLTKKRAIIVAKLFLKEGIDKNNLSVKAGGDYKPLVKDRDSYGVYLANEGHLNRRLELRMAFKNEGVL